MKSRLLPLLLVAATYAGCSAFSIPETPAVSSPIAPVWNAGEMRRNLTFLHDRSVRGRVDGTVGYGVAASYAGEQLEEYGLQPATAGDFRLLYTTPRNLVRASRFRIGVTDTVNLRPGIDFVADGRTSNAFVAVSGVGIADSAEAWSGPAIPLLLREPQSGRQLELLRDLGVPMVLVEHDDLTPRPARRAVAGIGVMNVASRSIDRVLEQAQPADALGRGVLRLRRPVRIEVIADFDRTASGINVVGYVPGKDPRLAREAVILVTHLDAVGSFGGVDYTDLSNYGVEVAAVLEVARQFAYFSGLLGIPERTLIVALVAGGTVDSGGLRALLRQPVWDAGKVRALVYAGLPAGGRDSLKAAAGTYAGRLKIVTATDTIPKVFIPITASTPELSRLGERSKERQRANARTYLDEAVRSARELAGRLYSIVGLDLVEPSAAALTPIEGSR